MSAGDYGADAFARDAGVSRETLDRFQTWRDLLEETNAHTNLVGRSTVADFWARHALDSWQVFELAPDAPRWVDLGAGAGFPGLAIAFGLMDRSVTGGHVTLVDSVGKKAAFLSRVIGATGAPARALAVRAESLDPVPEADVVTARAMAPLDKLLGYVAPYVENGALALLPKGARYHEELTRARKSWTFEVEVIPSRTSPEAAILKIEGLSRVR
ncbi:MAG: 16S rRNA (guanine(527)-N(7))-methyltransferase RsmG [Oceanicaulis sp.]